MQVTIGLVTGNTIVSDLVDDQEIIDLCGGRAEAVSRIRQMDEVMRNFEDTINFSLVIDGKQVHINPAFVLTVQIDQNIVDFTA